MGRLHGEESHDCQPYLGNPAVRDEREAWRNVDELSNRKQRVSMGYSANKTQLADVGDDTSSRAKNKASLRSGQ